MCNWFVQSPNDTRSCRRKIHGSAFDDFSGSSMLEIIGRQVGVMSNWLVQSSEILQKKQLMDQLLMISVLLLCWQ